MYAQVPKGVYVPKNDVAKSLHFAKFDFTGGNKVKGYIGMNGVPLGVVYDYVYTLKGNTLSFSEAGQNGSVEFTYDKVKDEISLLAGAYDTEGAIWGKEGESKKAPEKAQEKAQEKAPEKTPETAQEKEKAQEKAQKQDTNITDYLYYEENGIHFLEIPIAKFKIEYFDKPKVTSSFSNYFNLGYFQAGFNEEGKTFTLPVANLVCDIVESEIPEVVMKYLKERKVVNGKLYWNCDQNVEAQFKGKNVSTLIIYQNMAHIAKCNRLADNVKYAVSGAPVIAGGNKVPWNVVSSEGWGEDIKSSTWHGLLTVKNGKIIYVALNTSWDGIYDKIRSYGFTNVIKVDGGGSFIFVKEGKTIANGRNENRQINNIAIY